MEINDINEIHMAIAPTCFLQTCHLSGLLTLLSYITTTTNITGNNNNVTGN